MRSLFTVALALCVTAVSAGAGNTVTFTFVGTKTLGGTDYHVWDMLVTCTTDWTDAIISVELTTGSFYDNTEWSIPSHTEVQSEVWVAFPDVEWDTCVTSPTAWNDGVAVVFGAGDPNATPPIPPTPIMDSDTMSYSWADTDDDGAQTNYMVARITFTTDADGDITGIQFDKDTAGTGVSFDEYYVLDGVILPEPATMLLLGLGGAGVLLRRRR